MSLFPVFHAFSGWVWDRGLGQAMAFEESYSCGIALCQKLKISGKSLGQLYVNRAQVPSAEIFFWGGKTDMTSTDTDCTGEIL